MELKALLTFTILLYLGSVVTLHAQSPALNRRTSETGVKNGNSQRKPLKPKDDHGQCQRPVCPPTQDSVEIQNPRSPCPEIRCVTSTKCDIDGSFIQTFDGLRLQYHMCSQVLAREKDEWSVDLHKICPENKICQNQVTITQGGHTIALNAEDSSVEYNGFTYTTEQAAFIGDRTSEFSLSFSGNDIFFESQLYGFWVSVKETGDINVGVSSVLTNYVDGTCGKYNGIPSDDTTDPDGNFIRTTQEFGDSWKIKNESKCHDPKCTMEHRLKAFQICSSLSSLPVLMDCNRIVSIDLSIGPCLERTCTCLKYQPEDSCRCEATLKFVKQCQVKDPSTKLLAWRDELKCPITCPDGMQYTDCFKRFCEPSCENVHDKNACPISDHICSAGCFCPENLVRKGNKCVKPEECKDCYCWGWGDPHYTNYDGTKFDFQGACTFVATRDVALESEEHTFEVLVHNSKCYFAPTTTCTDGISVLYDQHVVFVRRIGDKIETYVDGVEVNNFPMTTDWLYLESQPKVQVTVVIPEIQLEAKYIYHLWRFELRIASHVFQDNFEGLCGTCNRDKTDDFKTKNGKITKDMNEFGMSWLRKNLPRGIIVEENCKDPPTKVTVVNDCVPGFPLTGQDPCLWITDTVKFGKCHALVETESFVQSCHYDMCHSVDRSAVGCITVASYVRECQMKGICLEWRTGTSCPFSCPPGEVYKSCGSSCEITCENYQNPKCKLDKTEGCFCPDGQVRRGGKCVPVSNCKACDAASHFIGDNWITEECTNCTCIEVMGVPSIKCSKIMCPTVDVQCKKGFTPIKKSVSEVCCPKYECIEQACKIDHKYIKTFDGKIFECEITNHVLIQDVNIASWKVLLKLDCPATNGGKCKRVVSIHQGKYELKIFSDGSFQYDGDDYTIEQAGRIGQQNKEFKINRLCDSSVYFESLLHGFWLIYDKNEILKLVITQQTAKNSVGLCGKMNTNQQDDTTTREGKLTTSITEVCNSWKEPGPIITTTTETCNVKSLTQGLEVCKTITEKQPMSLCTKLLDQQWFLDTCKYRMCECLQSKTEQVCRCEASLELFKICYVEAAEIKLDSWREQVGCPVSCPTGFVFKDCFSPKCEPTCDLNGNMGECDQMPNTCVSGCVCAPGFVRKGDKCVKPSDCRDCVCDGYGDPHYMTFDRHKFDYQGKCTYIAARDVVTQQWKKHKFQVLVTNEECVVAPGTSCTHAVTVVYQHHVVTVARIEGQNKVTIKLDGQLMTRFPLRNAWINVEVVDNNVVTLFVPTLQLQVRYIYKTWGFDISLPSHMFPDNVEGLCGNCNKDPKDDLRTLQGTITTNINEFAQSWLVKDVPSEVEQKEECKTTPPKPPSEKTCIPPTPDKDHCDFIMDKNIFQLCHRVVPPGPFLESCRYDVCHGVDGKTIKCLTIEAYARECNRHGICLNWRSNQHCPMKCPIGTVYKGCGSSCALTCDNFKKYRNDPSLCQVDPVEGCFCPDGQVLKDGKCISECECDSHNQEIESGVGCTLKPMLSRQTISLITENKKKHGKCENKTPIPKFGICNGFCESSSKYNPLLATFLPEGDCCQISNWGQVSVILTCADGFTYTKEMKIPNSCACKQCPLASAPSKKKTTIK